MINIKGVHLIFQVVDVISGKYDDSIGSVLIVDCRYPYEYDGGHVPVSVQSENTIKIPNVIIVHIGTIFISFYSLLVFVFFGGCFVLFLFFFWFFFKYSFIPVHRMPLTLIDQKTFSSY